MDLFHTLLLLLLSVGGCMAQDALPDGPVYALVGKNVTFNTTVGRGEHFLTISWTFNGGEELVPVITVAPSVNHVGEGYEGRVWVDTTTGVLTLGPVQPTDNGDYSVSMVDSKAVTQTGETSLRVLVPVSKVEIKSSPAEAVETNSTVTLTCTALGSFLTFTWTNGTLPLMADGKRITIKDEEMSSSVTIVGVRRRELKGPIRCSATNKLETGRSAPFNMSVHYGPEAVMMTATPSAAAGGVLRKGSNVTLSCSAVSSPPATLSWFHDGVAVAGQTGPTLVLRDLSAKQGGAYRCSAHNPKTLRTVDAPTTTFTVMEAISGTKITPPKEALTAGDAMLNFTCVATAGVVTTTTWLKDGKPLVTGERVMIAAGGSPLMIKKLQKEDRGEYKCQLTNAVNTASASYNMVVFYGPDDVKVTGKNVEVNDKVTLRCNVDSFPVPQFAWRFNGTYLPAKTQEYTVAKAAFKDAGMYTCEVANARTALNGSSTFQLAVKEEGALDDGLTGGAIAGIVIGVLVALALAIAGFIYCKRKQTIESPY